MVIASSDNTSEGIFGSTGRLQEVGINRIDYETCSDLYDGDIDDSAMLFADVPGRCEDSCQGDSGGPNSRTRSEGLDRCEVL
jgi:secreted trypsin-like serine protease